MLREEFERRVESDDKRGSAGVKRQSLLAEVWEGAHVNKRRHGRFNVTKLKLTITTTERRMRCHNSESVSETFAVFVDVKEYH